MTTNNDFIFNKLPIECINKCINYTGKVTFRNGKYINKLSKDDERYKICGKITPVISLLRNKYVIYLRRNIVPNEGMCLYYTLNDENNRIILEIISNRTNAYLMYVFDSNSVWCRLMNYVM